MDKSKLKYRRYPVCLNFHLDSMTINYEFLSIISFFVLFPFSKPVNHIYILIGLLF